MADREQQIGYEHILRCPICRINHVTPRKSVYGMFYGCNNYPRCLGKLTIAQADRQIRDYIGCDEPDDCDFGNGGDYDPGGTYD